MISQIKKIIFVSFVFFLILFISNNSHSQTLQFCEDVSKDGEAITASSVFSINTEGGFLKCLTKLPYRVGTTEVSYEIYKVDADGVETYDNTIYQEVDPSWTWFWKEITFYKAGRYNVNVYDGDKNFLASSLIRIQYY